tara:strand:+ start:347 stop:538 length:192 start_codon:yes stop_codon:yes gene_type:complete
MIDNIANIISVLSIHTAGGTTVDPRDVVRAVIEAMRDPTPSMIDAGDREIYMKMIDVALNSNS